MNKSDNINELSSALAKAMGEIQGAKMDSINPHFKNRFASLASVQDSYKVPCSKNGLSVVQSVETRDGKYFVETMITHSSGQWISSDLELILSREDMQGLGSACTYAKRYAVCAMLGISAQDEDDDGNAASLATNKNNQVIDQLNQSRKGKPTEAQLKRLFAISKAQNWNPKLLTEYMFKNFQKNSSHELNLEEYQNLCEMMEKNPRVDIPEND